MAKYIYSIGSTTTGESTGELEIEANNSLEAWRKAQAAKKTREGLNEGETLFEWREEPQRPTGVKRR